MTRNQPQQTSPTTPVSDRHPTMDLPAHLEGPRIPTTYNVFELFASRDDFLGFGYIGERRNTLEGIRTGEISYVTAADVVAADTAILALADRRGWDDDRLFAWANSKDGRWFADTAFGCNDLPTALRRHI